MTVGTVVCRSRINCGKTQTDSNMMENDHKTCTCHHSAKPDGTHQPSPDGTIRPPYLYDKMFSCSSNNKRDKRRGKHGTSQRDSPKFPSPLSFSCPGIDLHHKIDNIKRGQNVKDLKHKVPFIRVRGQCRPEQVKISRAEHGRIENLRDQRDACLAQAKRMKNSQEISLLFPPQCDETIYTRLLGDDWKPKWGLIHTFGALVPQYRPYQDTF